MKEKKRIRDTVKDRQREKRQRERETTEERQRERDHTRQMLELVLEDRN